MGISILTRSAFALVASFFAILVFNYLGTLTPQARIETVIHEAENAGILNPWIDVDNDMFTECAMFDMALIRDRNPLRDMLATAFSMPAPHPCDGLRKHLAGLNDERPPVFKYHYGSRHLFAVLAAFLSLNSQRSLMGILSILAPLLLGAVFFLKARKQAFIILPFVFTLIVGFGYSHLGRNLAHAPGFVFPIIGLAGVVAYRSFFTPVAKRFSAYAVIATAAVYFDNLSGPLPFILAVVVIVNHFCFNAKEKRQTWLKESFWIGILFVSTYLTIVGLKLVFATIIFDTNPIPEFRRSLSIRFSLSDGEKLITRSQTFRLLWESCGISFFGDVAAAKLFYIIGAISWLGALVVVAIRRTAWRETLILTISSIVIVIWYLIFVNHTWIHYRFMGRIGVLPAVAGIMALMAVANRVLTYIGVAAVPFVGVVIVAQTTILAPRIVGVTPTSISTVDIASCSNDLEIRPDGKPDIIWRVEIDAPRIFETKILEMNVERNPPGGLLSTRPGSFPLAVLTADGGLLNAPNRSIKIRIKGRTELLVAFCDDGAGSSESRYSLTGRTSHNTFTFRLSEY